MTVNGKTPVLSQRKTGSEVTAGWESWNYWGRSLQKSGMASEQESRSSKKDGSESSMCLGISVSRYSKIFIDFQMIRLCNLDNAANREFLTILENSWDFLRMPGTTSCILGTLSHTLSAFGIRIIYCLPTIEKNLARRLPQRYDLRQPLVKLPELEFWKPTDF